MPFQYISCVNFRNLDNKPVDFSAKEVFFVGENGQGKSNLLESIYYASYGSSFRTRTDTEIVRHGESGFSIRAVFKDESEKINNINIYFENGKKRIEKNGKALTDRKDLISVIPCILFCHEDLDFADGEPEKKRFFIDQSATLYDVLYVNTMRNYKKILKSRNILLKEHNYTLLETLNYQLAEAGLEIKKKRREVIEQFNRFFDTLYKEVTGIENVSVFYNPSWKADNVSEIMSVLKQKEEVDKSMCTTMSGPHRDMITFVKDEKLFVPTASTGQKRLLSILLRVSQAIYCSTFTGKKPVFLMDDVLLELDPQKRQKVTSLLPEYNQLFCTYLPGEPYEKYKRQNTKVYFIENGTWHE